MTEEALNKWAAEVIRHGLFSQTEVEALLSRAIEKETRGKVTTYVTCLVRDKEVQLKPEEGVRQLWLARILGRYGYIKKRVAVEYLACCRFRGHREKVFHEAGGGIWRGEYSVVSSRSRPFVWFANEV